MIVLLDSTSDRCSRFLQTAILRRPDFLLFQDADTSPRRVGVMGSLKICIIRRMVFQWTKESAIKELRALAADAETLATQRRYSADHTKWIANVLAVLEEVFGRESRYFLTFASLSWSHEGQLIIGGIRDPEGSLNPQAAIERRHHQAFLSQLETARGLLLAAAEHLEKRDLETVYEGKDTPPESSSLVRILTRKIHDFRSTKGLAMVQIRYLGGFETKSEAFA